MAGPPVRERYNAKARGSTAGGSHKKRKRIKSTAPADPSDPSAAGNSGATRDAEESREEAEGDGRGKMSSKKRKRMDSYINKKLKTDERYKTLQLLASLTPSASTSAALASSATLGQNPLAPTSANERVAGKEDRMVRRGIDTLRKRFGSDGSESDSEGDELTSGKGRKGKGRAVEIITEVGDLDPSSETAQPATSAKTKKTKQKKSNWNPSLLKTQPESDSSSDFDSSDSEYDSPKPAPVELPKDTSQTTLGNAEDTVTPVEKPIAGPSSPRSDPLKAVETGSALKPTGSALKKPPVVLPPKTLGGALKKSSDGAVVKPRVVVRQKMPLGRRRQVEEDEDEDESEEPSDEEDEDEDGSESEEDHSDADDDRDDEVGEGNEDEEDEEEDEDESEDEPSSAPKKRALGFKDWALKQMGQPVSSSTSSPIPEPPSFAFAPTSKVSRSAPKTGEFVGPLGATLTVPTTSLIDTNSKVDKTAIPTLKRRPSVAESRMDLPILAEEQAIVESIRMNPVVIIAGETGSGKTTQVPQMLYEAGFGFKGSDNPGMIAVTQPRRVAAVSLSTRVRDELGFAPNSSVVAHQIRYSSSTSAETSIKFMTDGVLLRELSSDFLLSRYSVVVVDEAHERGVNTDVLIGVLSRVAKLREAKWRENKSGPIKPLRIVIMSATLRIEDFASNKTLFDQVPPVIHIPARQHPVTMHFSRKTTGDYVGEAFKKVCKIHARLPAGGVLVFLTGQAEIQQLCRRLEKKYKTANNAGSSGKGSKGGKGRKDIEEDKKEERSTNEVALAAEEREAEDVDLGKDEDLAADVDDGDAEVDPEALDTDDEDADFDIDESSDAPLHILPLYSLLPNDQQLRVFKPPPEGHRLVIVATNVAETSLTIPGIRYVVDSGRSKERQYDHQTGVQSFQVGWISKASANQRAGRAGRTGPGHCYRLYSSALFEDHFEKFSIPEIQRMPIEGVVLQMKSMNIDQVVNFPFPTPPDRASLAKAEKLLVSLGALSKPTISRMVGGTSMLSIEGGRITDLGKAMAGYPVAPRFGKMLVLGDQGDCLPFITAIVACLSVGDPFIHETTLDVKDDEESGEEDDGDEDVKRGGRKDQIGLIRSEQLREKEERKELRKQYFHSQSRFLGLGKGTSDMFKMLAAVGAYEYDPTPLFCAQNFLRLKAMQEIQQLRGQISAITKQPMARLSPPTDTQVKIIRQIITAASLDRVAVRQDIFMKKKTTFTSCRNVPYRAVGLGSQEIFVHPSSALFHKPPPDFLAFHEITRGQTGKNWIKGITAVNPAWLATLGKSSCSFSKPEVMTGLAGAKGKKGKVEEVKQGEREVFVTPHFEDLGVDLPVVRMKQRREGTRWVLVE